MVGKLKKYWLRIIIAIYVLIFVFQVIAAGVTVYALEHPELGLFEREESTRNNIAVYGLTLGILISFVQGFFWYIIPFFCLVIYWHEDRKNIEFTRWGPSVYSGFFSYGLSMLMIWFADAFNDLSWLFFHEASTWTDWFINNFLLALLVGFGILFVLSLTTYYLAILVRYRKR